MNKLPNKYVEAEEWARIFLKRMDALKKRYIEDEIEFYIGELIVDILEDVGEVFAPKQPDGSPERKKLLGLVGDIQPYRERATQAILAAINKTIMESLPKKIHTHSIEELKSLSAGGDANEGFGYERGYNQALEDVRQQITKKYGRADNGTH